RPALPEYGRNRAYTWQRITSWILLFAITAHLVQMRFINQPSSAAVDGQHYYMVRLEEDAGLFPISKRLKFGLYNQAAIEAQAKMAPGLQDYGLGIGGGSELIERQKLAERQEFVSALQAKPLKEGQIIAATHDFATAMLLVIRDTFKSPLMQVLYTLFVLSAS